MRPSPQLAVVVLLLAVGVPVVGACGASGAQSPASPTAVPSASPTAEPVTTVVPPAVMDAARAELAKRVGADAAATATVVTAVAVDWPDSSLGCPQPGMMYMQVITPGYQVVFEVDGTQYDIRATAAGGAVLCEPGQKAGG